MTNAEGNQQKLKYRWGGEENDSSFSEGHVNWASYWLEVQAWEHLSRGHSKSG